MLAPNRQTVSTGIRPPSTLRPRACGCPYEIAIRDGPDRLASSSYQRLPMRRALRCTSTVAWLLAAMRNGVGAAWGAWAAWTRTGRRLPIHIGLHGVRLN